MSYAAPVKDIAFAMRHVAGLAKGQADGLYADLDDATLEAVLEEAARFAAERLAPAELAG